MRACVLKWSLDTRIEIELLKMREGGTIGDYWQLGHQLQEIYTGAQKSKYLAKKCRYGKKKKAAWKLNLRILPHDGCSMIRGSKGLMTYWRIQMLNTTGLRTWIPRVRCTILWF